MLTVDQDFIGAVASGPTPCFLHLNLILIRFILFGTFTRRPRLFPSGGLLFLLASPTFLPPLSPFLFPLKEHIFSF